MKENKSQNKIGEIKYNIIDKFKTNDFLIIEKIINQKLAKIVLYQEK